VEKYGTAREATDSSIIRRMRIACWIIKATDTYSEYVGILIAFTWQRWLRECASMLRLYVIACLVTFYVKNRQKVWFFLSTPRRRIGE
jgi:hypothetical protein